MADYYSILKKTISSLGNNTPEIRAAVYGKARSAIETQLRNMNPTPAEHAVQAQLKLLEEAITLIESENTETSVATGPVVTNPAMPAAAPSSTVSPAPAEDHTQQAVEPPAAPPPAYQDAVQTASQIVEAQSAPPPASVNPPQSAQPLATPQVEAMNVPVEPAQTPPAPAPQTPVNYTEPVPSVVSEPQPQPSAEVNIPEQITPPQQAPAETIDAPLPERKRGSAIKFVPWVLSFILVCVGVFAAWSNRDTIKSTIESTLFGDGNDLQVEQPLSDKEPVRIGQNGEDTTVEPVTGTSEDEGTTQIVLTPPKTDDKPELVQTPEPQPEPENTTIAESTPEQEISSGPESGSETQQPEAVVSEPVTEPEPAPLGEVAYLYEEGSGGSGATRSAGGVVWETVRESPGEGFAPEPIITGNINVAEKDIAAQLTIKRNTDEALSASHLIELNFTFGNGFQGGGIDNVARFVMKATEEARGEPLVAVPVKVSDGKFLIALNNLQQAVDVNTLLLNDGGWIDIPITYSNGKRALVTLEKGGTGERVFSEALNDWKNR